MLWEAKYYYPCQRVLQPTRTNDEDDGSLNSCYRVTPEEHRKALELFTKALRTVRRAVKLRSI